MKRTPESSEFGIGIGAAFGLSSENSSERDDPPNESPKPLVRNSLSKLGESVVVSLPFQVGSGYDEGLTFQAPEVTRPDLCPLTKTLSFGANFHDWFLSIDKLGTDPFPRILLFVGSLRGLEDLERGAGEGSGLPRRIGVIGSKTFSRVWTPLLFEVEVGDCGLYVTRSSRIAFAPPTFIERGESGAGSGIAYANRDFVPLRR